METIRKPLVYLAILSTAAVIGYYKNGDYVTNNYDPVKMDAAIARARLEFDSFRERLLNPQPGDSDFNVKIKIQDANGVEHFWLYDPVLTSEPYTGRIANDPEIVKNISPRQIHSFARDDVSDWMYRSNGMMQGGYTIRVLMEDMNPSEATELKKSMGW